MTLSRTLAALAAAAAALVVAGSASAAPPPLVGTVGPGFTITLTQKGKAVKKLKAGRYTITVRDKSSIHNFHLVGPRLNKEITGVAFVGTKTIRVVLRKGTYRFVCDPHATIMKGSFRVV